MEDASRSNSTSLLAIVYYVETTQCHGWLSHRPDYQQNMKLD